MKQITFIISIFTLLTASLPAQLLNPDLSEWEDITTSLGVVDNPLGWMTNNEPPFAAVANSPVTIGVTDTSTYARIESNFRSIDALGPGWMSQTIALADLLSIGYSTQCDSLADKGYCLVEVLIANSREQLYGDTIRTISEVFTTRSLSVPTAWAEATDSVTLKFTAFGDIFQLQPEDYAYAVFFVDEAQANYQTDATTATTPENKLTLWPNPATDHIRVHGAEPTSLLSIFDLNGRLLQTATGTLLDVSKLSEGTYVLKATTYSVTRTGKFVKR